MRKTKEDLLIEFQVEDLPPLSLKQIYETINPEIAKIFTQFRLPYDKIEFFATPRRLTLLIKGLAISQEPISSVIIGPPFDAPLKAKEKFSQRIGINIENLRLQETDKGKYWVAHKIEEGKSTEELLPQIIKKIIYSIKFSKYMRWAKEDFYFARPIRRYLLIWKEVRCNFSILGINGVDYTQGWQRWNPESKRVTSVTSYFKAIEEMNVILSPEERRNKIIKEANMLAENINCSVKFDPLLLDKIIFSTETPLSILCNFPSHYLNLPDEVISEVLISSQQLFPLYKKYNSHLAAYFIYVADIRDAESAINEIRRGVEEALLAKLEDAEFYWQEDIKLGLNKLKEKTKYLLWDEILGSLEDKVQRISRLGKWVCDKVGIKEDIFREGVKFSKADVASHMVQEYPHLSGIMGYYYGKREKIISEDALIAIKEYHCRDDKLPTTDYGKILALVDKIDTLVGLFSRGFAPSGSHDPYGLRKEGYIVVQLLTSSPIFANLSLFSLFQEAKNILKVEFSEDLKEFFKLRLRGVLTDFALKEDTINIILSLEDNVNYPYFAKLKGEVLEEFMIKEKEAFSLLVTLHKRLKNILINEDLSDIRLDEQKFSHEEERLLFYNYSKKKEEVEAFLKEDKFYAYLKAIAELSQPADDFFKKVYVMVEEITLRKNRLKLLELLYHLISRIGDLSIQQPA